MRLYATFKNTTELLALYRGRDLDGLTRFTVALLRAVADRAQQSTRSATSQLYADIRAIAAPSLDWRAAFVTDAYQDAAVAALDVVPDELIIAYELPSAEHVQLFLDFVNSHRNVPLDPAGNAFLAAGLDPGASVADHRCPGAANLAVFGHRERARRTIRAGRAYEPRVPGAAGQCGDHRRGSRQGTDPGEELGRRPGSFHCDRPRPTGRNGASHIARHDDRTQHPGPRPGGEAVPRPGGSARNNAGAGGDQRDAGGLWQPGARHSSIAYRSRNGRVHGCWSMPGAFSIPAQILPEAIPETWSRTGIR